MSTHNILNHVKAVCTQNDQLYTSVNKIEKELNDVKTTIEEFEKRVTILQEKENNIPVCPLPDVTDFITIKELEIVVHDIKQSLEFVLNATPRQGSDIEALKCELKELRKFCEDVKASTIPPISVEAVKRSIPKLELQVKKR